MRSLRFFSLLIGTMLCLSFAPEAHASCTAPANPIEAENCLSGTPSSQWDISGAGDPSIQGFATGISFNRGQTVLFKINTNATSYKLDIYRMGYYGGMGARLVTTVSPSATLPQTQPACISQASTGLIDCGNWAVSASWAIPANATSGIYFAKIIRLDNGGANHIFFVVRNDASTSDIIFKTSDTTWQAYNDYGGKSLYTGGPGPKGGAFKVSYNRPFRTRAVEFYSWIFNAEYPMVRWLEANGYDVTYLSSIDVQRSGSLILQHKAFLSVGHDEYWSGTERANVEAARAAGVHIGFFSSNLIFWKTRWEPSIDGSNTPNRTLVSYKETHANSVIDPQDPPTWTGTWRDPRFSPPADGGRPENALAGTLFMVNGPGPVTEIRVPAEDGKMRFWRNTSVASLPAGQTYTTSGNLLGYEWDVDLDNGFRPAGLFHLSSATYNIAGRYLLDYGSTYGNGTATHTLTLYRHFNAGNSSLVFSSGTTQFAWALDGNHDGGASTPDSNIQQAVVNLFADMGVQPKTLQGGLVTASASSDTVPPNSTITSPAPGSSVQSGSVVTIRGTAADTGGGVVAGVEVSTDGGTTWHPASGRGNWTYNWTPTTSGATTIRSRAVDDTGNIETPSAGVNTTVATRTCPCSIWSSSVTPTVIDDGDPAAVELGVRFRADVDGFITGIRFYKSTANTGTHVGNLWTNTGTLLGRATFSGESGSGWQEVKFASPVAITASTTYVASYFAPRGHYSGDQGYFAGSGVANAPLHALADGVNGVNGAYTYAATSSFPQSTFNSSNYWVDVVFETAPAVTSVTPAHNATDVSTSSSVTATFDKAMNAATINTSTFQLLDPSNAVVPATVTYNTQSRTATLQPNSALAFSTKYTAVVKGGATGVKDTAGTAMTSDVSWSFTTAAAPAPPAPTVTSFTPANNATGVNPTTSVTATFDQAMDPATINSATFQLKDPSNSVVSATVSYNALNLTATLQPNSELASATTYSAVVKGGGTGVKAVSGVAMASSLTWLFTIASPPPPPPSSEHSLWSSSTVPNLVDANDPGSVELGVRFRADVDGSITGIRFYKASTNTGTHIGNLWTNTGSLLATTTFSGESASGWQQMNFATPVAITANTTYVASYFAPNGHYSANLDYFTAAFDNPPLHALRDGTDGPNGVFTYSSTGAFPASTHRSANYWVDVVFVPTDSTSPPTVTSVVPANGSTGVSLGQSVRAVFSKALNSSTVNGTTFLLRDSTNIQVPADVTYDSSSNTAILNPTLELTPLTTYTATVKGGASGVKDVNGNAMASDFTWSFTTGAVPPGSGPGGPILVVSSATNPFTRYYGEILSGEGLNEFTISSMSGVTASTLANYDVVILGQMALTSSQVSMLSNWVNAGGNLIAMRPDKQLAGLLGLTPSTSTLSNAYLVVDTASGPGVGIVGQSMQFHGTADLYSLNGAQVLATLFSTASTATTSPAVTLNNVGSGKAAAFSYDLARSVVYTRQGNPAWSGQERDGQPGPIRSNDLFFGAASFDPQPDWVNLDKVSIPQADEQQRLLANLILHMNTAKKPLPRFWYFPRDLKAVVIMTGDDHANGGTVGRFDSYISRSPAGCSVADWECIRGTSYIYTPTPLSNAQAASYASQGFEIALHVATVPNCSNYTAASLDEAYTSQLSEWAAKYTSLPAPKTNRTHCVAFSEYDNQPKIALSHGIRMDTNYYYWPASWVNDRPGMFTGSGMPQRFADRSGNTIDVYQATSQMTDESAQSFPLTINTLLDNALGPQGFYGAFTANMHTDFNPSAGSQGSDAIVASAQARGVPVVTAQQMLTWLDGRNSSSFGSLSWNASRLSFNINVGTGARNLRAMLPTASSGGTLSAISANGSPVSFTTQTVKGIEYAFFNAVSGSYQALYGPVTWIISGTISGPGGNGATVTLTGSGNATTTADASGSYSFSGLANGSYNVTPSKIGFIFTPPSRSVTVSNGDVTAVNFTSEKILTVTSVSLNPSTVTGGNTSTGTVTLDSSAPPEGAVVTLSSDNPAASVPPSVTVAAGATTANFTVSTTAVSSITAVTISASLNGVTKTAGLTVNPPVTVSSVTLNPATVVGGNTSTGTVTLGSPAPSGGATVALSSNNPAATVPPSVTVAAGATTANFTVSTSAVPSVTAVTISASLNGVTKTASLTVNPPVAVSAVTLNPTTVVGGNPSAGTVTLGSPAPSGGATVALSSDNPAASVPASVTVLAGATTANFTVTTSVVSLTTPVTISGSLNSVKTAVLTVNPATLSSVSLSPTSVVSGSNSTGTVTLTGKAPAGGATVALSSNNPAATAPASVTVAAGATSATFVVTTSGVSSNTTGAISGSYGGQTRTADLTVTPADLVSISLSPDTVVGGNSSTATVTLNGTAPSGGAVITLSKTNAAATVPPSVTIAAGATTATFTVGSVPVTAVTTGNITASYRTLTRSATFTVLPPALSSLTVSPNSVMGGSQSTGRVTLTGVAAADITVALSSNNIAAAVPPNVVVPAGSDTATFTILTTPVLTNTSVTITATYNGATRNATLTVRPPL